MSLTMTSMILERIREAYRNLLPRTLERRAVDRLDCHGRRVIALHVDRLNTPHRQRRDVPLGQLLPGSGWQSLAQSASGVYLLRCRRNLPIRSDLETAWERERSASSRCS